MAKKIGRRRRKELADKEAYRLFDEGVKPWQFVSDGYSGCKTFMQYREWSKSRRLLRTLKELLHCLQ